MPSQAAEQIIAGVVLSERLAVTMYGAIHRAQFSGQRNLRGLVIDQKMLAEDSFRVALTDAKLIKTVLDLEHEQIVPTFAVESNGPDVVVVTRGVGRYVTVQDLISAARANRAQGGKLPLPVAAAIGRSVVEALAAAHQAKVVHGAVHPRSVLVDEDGAVRLGDFIVGRALTTAVAQGADSSLWRGLAGYLAPEVVVGEDPTPSADVFAAGAMLFTMLSGEAPPGTLHVTPAVERLVQRALDTDISRRYKNASDLLENLLEAFEDDRWDIAERGEVIKAAGLSTHRHQHRRRHRGFARVARAVARCRAGHADPSEHGHPCRGARRAAPARTHRQRSEQARGAARRISTIRASTRPSTASTSSSAIRSAS